MVIDMRIMNYWIIFHVRLLLSLTNKASVFKFCYVLNSSKNEPAIIIVYINIPRYIINIMLVDIYILICPLDKMSTEDPTYDYSISWLSKYSSVDRRQKRQCVVLIYPWFRKEKKEKKKHPSSYPPTWLYNVVSPNVNGFVHFSQQSINVGSSWSCKHSRHGGLVTPFICSNKKQASFVKRQAFWVMKVITWTGSGWVRGQWENE